MMLQSQKAEEETMTQGNGVQQSTQVHKHGERKHRQQEEGKGERGPPPLLAPPLQLPV